MLPKSIFKTIVAGSAATTIALAATPALAQKLVDPAAPTDPCSIDADWLSSPVPDPETLATGDNFQNACGFLRWSWNAFLWAMEDVDGVARFETLPDVENVINGDYTAPSPDLPTLKLRLSKSNHPIEGVAQAATPGILVDQNGRAVYYSQYVNQQMYDQIIAQNWNTYDGLRAAPDTERFQDGNTEFKAAWKIVGESDDVTGLYVRQALVPRLEQTTSATGVTTIAPIASDDPDAYMTETVALVGLHVVGWVYGHSEAIWATFSPPNLAPIAPQPLPAPDTVLSEVSTLFYAGGTAFSDCNQAATPIQELQHDSQTFAVMTNACQIYAYGFPTPKDELEAFQSGIIVTPIVEINHSAGEGDPKAYAPQNYQLLGATWTISDWRAYCDWLDDPGSEPDCAQDSSRTAIDKPEQIIGKLNNTLLDMTSGSTLLSNPLIETFTQITQSQNNCLSCHNSMQYQPSERAIEPLQGSMLNTSHIILQAYVSDAP